MLIGPRRSIQSPRQDLTRQIDEEHHRGDGISFVHLPVFFWTHFTISSSVRPPPYSEAEPSLKYLIVGKPLISNRSASSCEPNFRAGSLLGKIHKPYALSHLLSLALQGMKQGSSRRRTNVVPMICNDRTCGQSLLYKE